MNFLSKCYRALISSVILSTCFFSSHLYAEQYAESGFILTSIKPIQLIAADITQGVIKVEALLSPGASPHAYSLRPSDVKKIHNAAALFWIGPSLETFLQKSFSQYADKSHALFGETSLEHKELKQESHDENLETHAEHDHEEAKKETNEHIAEDNHSQHQHKIKVHVHTYQGNDPHIWLSPVKSQQIAAIIRDEMIKLYPKHQATLNQNYQQFVAELAKLDLQLKSQFSSLKALGFVVFHDAYSRFVEHYQLNQIAALTINPSKRPGAKHLVEIRQMISQDQPVCIFSEPQFSGAAIEAVVRDLPIHIGLLDPLAIETKATQNRYASFLALFAQQFINCLGR